MTTSPLRRKVYDVFLNPVDYDPATADPFDVEGVTVHRVAVAHGDQLRGELEAKKRGVDIELGQAMTSIIVWAALARTGVDVGKYDAFRARVADIQNARQPDGAAVPDVEVPPTGEPSGSVSPSPVTSPDSSPTGSTLT